MKTVMIPLLCGVLLIAMAGCTTAAPEVDEIVTPIVQPTRTAAPLVLIEPGLTVATGVLSSPDGSISGTVAVVTVEEGKFDLTFALDATVDQEIVVNLSTEPWDEQRYCDGGFVMMAFGSQLLSDGSRVDISWDDLTLGNPDFIDDVVITAADILNTPKTGCFYPVVASAPLVWTLPDMRPSLVLTDSGETGGAAGIVKTDGSQLLSYTVAPDDLLAEIAARFGVTIDDIFSLNPSRDAGYQVIVRDGEVLNLDKTKR